METIIQQIALELVKKIIEKAYSGGINDIDALASDVLQDCKTAALAIEVTCAEINVNISTSKYGSKIEKTGTTRAIIYQTKKERKESKLHVKYGHKKLAIVGGVSISKSPGITFGFGYDSTNPPEKKLIKY